MAALLLLLWQPQPLQLVQLALSQTVPSQAAAAAARHLLHLPRRLR
jgi:hypothetical protein